MLGDLFYRLGSAAGTLTAQLSGRAEPDGSGPRNVAVYDLDSEPVHEPDRAVPPRLEPDDDEDGFGSAAMIGTAWLLSTLFRARPVNWPRVIVSGIAATVLADLAGRIAGQAVMGREPFARDGDELRDRLGAGVAIAAGYAAILYPRIPGPPLFRGLVFGGLEIAAAPLGGLIGLAASAPGVRFPLQKMVAPIDADAGPISHLAFGLGLGLLYRSEP